MQIEEAFRDQKSQAYGLSSDAHRTTKKGRLEVLLLLAALANWLHYMLGLAAKLASRPTHCKIAVYYRSIIWVSECAN